MTKDGLTDAEKCLAEQCAEYVMGDAQEEALIVSTLGICAIQDVNMVVIYLQAFATSVLYNYIASHQKPEDLADQLFGKAIQGK